jgi:hypothetical protein
MMRNLELRGLLGRRSTLASCLKQPFLLHTPTRCAFHYIPQGFPLLHHHDFHGGRRIDPATGCPPRRADSTRDQRQGAATATCRSHAAPGLGPVGCHPCRCLSLYRMVSCRARPTRRVSSSRGRMVWRPNAACPRSLPKDLPERKPNRVAQTYAINIQPTKYAPVLYPYVSPCRP